MNGMKRHIPAMAVTAAGVLLAAAAGAGPVSAEPISAKFDGIYEGSRQLIAPLSGRECEAPSRYTIEIRNGLISGKAVPDGVRDAAEYAVKGFVTSDGFFTGTHEAETVERTLIQGRIDGQKMVGGLFTKGENCAWIVKLDKA